MKYSKEMLIAKCESGENLEYIFFSGHTSDAGKVTKACLSRWYACEFVLDEECYHSAGQCITEKKMRSGKIWDTHKYHIILRCCIAKFSCNPELWAYLDSTADAVLVELSPHDGICDAALSALHSSIPNPKLWCTDNLLGFALMETRDILRGRCKKNMCEVNRMDEELSEIVRMGSICGKTQQPDTERILQALGVTQEYDLVLFQKLDLMYYYSYLKKNEDDFMWVCLLFQKDNLWGAVSMDGRILTDAQWEIIHPMESGYRIHNVSEPNIFAKYREAQYFLKVELDGKFGILDTLGRTITLCKWDEIDRYGNCRAGELWGFVNLLTMEETPPQWNENQHLQPYTVIDSYKESTEWRDGCGPSCEWRTSCEIFDGSCLR